MKKLLLRIVYSTTAMAALVLILEAGKKVGVNPPH